MGDPDRATTQPWIPLLSAGKVAFDAAQAARLSWNEVREQHALSAWSLITAGMTGLSALLVAPEAYAAFRQVSSDQSRRRSTKRPGRRYSRSDIKKRKVQVG